ncbi:hypothetical protein GCM10007981_11880 [Thermocladium modestius]|uniref:Uncharacterized protein n=1 Tax=Thermocladium modestius TaxID=62609 RepID=A0A830GW65_9CREN|nr:hypothetical protein [Thermocladium modestius]GGP21167.1 hypothetical protein GCM10007981_11880 [Thermocladium modestius]
MISNKQERLNRLGEVLGDDVKESIKEKGQDSKVRRAMRLTRDLIELLGDDELTKKILSKITADDIVGEVRQIDPELASFLQVWLSIRCSQ